MRKSPRPPRIALEPFLDNDSRDFVVNSLDSHNIVVTGLADWLPANAVLRGDNNEIQGAALGYVWGGWLQVTYLWVTEELRGKGFGGQLLAEAESFARSNGAIAAALETHSFQARPFYEARGYRVVGEVADYPLGHSKFFLIKSLV